MSLTFDTSDFRTTEDGIHFSANAGHSAIRYVVSANALETLAGYTADFAMPHDLMAEIYKVHKSAIHRAAEGAYDRAVSIGPLPTADIVLGAGDLN